MLKGGEMPGSNMTLYFIFYWTEIGGKTLPGNITLNREDRIDSQKAIDFLEEDIEREMGIKTCRVSNYIPIEEVAFNPPNCSFKYFISYWTQVNGKSLVCDSIVFDYDRAIAHPKDIEFLEAEIKKQRGINSCTIEGFRSMRLATKKP
jgi:hypothetical protein